MRRALLSLWFATLVAGCGLPEGNTFVYPADAPELAMQNDCSEGVWESAPLPGDGIEPMWLPYPPRATLQVEHCLGRRPIEIDVYISFSENGAEGVSASGDLARFLSADETTLTIKNETSAMFFARIVAR